MKLSIKRWPTKFSSLSARSKPIVRGQKSMPQQVIVPRPLAQGEVPTPTPAQHKREQSQ